MKPKKQLYFFTKIIIEIRLKKSQLYNNRTNQDTKKPQLIENQYDEVFICGQ